MALYVPLLEPRLLFQARGVWAVRDCALPSCPGVACPILGSHTPSLSSHGLDPLCC